MLRSMERGVDVSAAIVVRPAARRLRLNQGEAHNPRPGEDAGWEIWLRNPDDGRQDYLGFEGSLEAALAPYQAGPLPVIIERGESPDG